MGEDNLEELDLERIAEEKLEDETEYDIDPDKMNVQELVEGAQEEVEQ